MSKGRCFSYYLNYYKACTVNAGEVQWIEYEESEYVCEYLCEYETVFERTAVTCLQFYSERISAAAVN